MKIRGIEFLTKVWSIEMAMRAKRKTATNLAMSFVTVQGEEETVAVKVIKERGD